MKKLGIGIGVVMVMLQLSAVAWAAPSFITSQDGTVTLSSPLNNDAYVAGGTVVVNQPIRGDLVVGGGTVMINADVTQDVWVVGGTVVVRGNIGDDVRICGGNVSVYGTVGNDVLAGGGNLTISKSAVIKGDLVMGAQDATVDGRVLGNVQIAAATAELSGTIAGNVKVRIAKQLVLGSGARIGGTLQYWAPTETAAANQVASKVEYHKLSPTTREWGKNWWGGWIWMLLTWLVLGLVWLLIWPKWLPKVAGSVKESYWPTMGWGWLLLIIAPIAMFVAVLTLLGLSVAVFLGVLYLLALALAVIAGAYITGGMLLRTKRDAVLDQFWALVLGLAIFLLLGKVPIVGGLAQLWIVAMGLGGVVREWWRTSRQYR